MSGTFPLIDYRGFNRVAFITVNQIIARPKTEFFQPVQMPQHG